MKLAVQLVITQHGKGVAVVLMLLSTKSMQEKIELLERNAVG